MDLGGEGHAARPATLDDLESILALILRVDEDELGEADMTLDYLRTDLTMPQVDLDRDSLVVTAPSGEVVGYLLTTAEGDTTTILDTYSHPDHRRGSNLDEYLLHEGVARARRASAAAGAATWTVAAWGVEEDARLDVIHAMGFRPQRHFIRMRRELVDLPAVGAPEGILLRNPDDEADLRAVHQVGEEAFTDHWGHEPESWEVFHHRKVARDTYDPLLWWLAEDADTGRVLGSIIGRAEWELDTGWIAMLGVRREGRGRGVGGALLRAAFRSLADAGLPRVELSVDADSLTGATRVYERQGMWRRLVLTRHAMQLGD